MIILNLPMLCCLMQPGPSFCYYPPVNNITTYQNIGLNQSKLSDTITLIIIIYIMKHKITNRTKIYIQSNI